MAFDFGQIGDIISKVCDSDYIDIKRDIDGKLQEVYSNIPCHIAYASTDNPDPKTVDIKPIIQSITVHCQLYVDIRNNDFIVAKKIGSDGSLIATYSGRCGNPVVSQGRKKVLMQMNGTENEEPTPVPPKDSAEIRISFVSDGSAIQDSQTRKAEIGKPFELQAPAIEGYEAVECYIDGDFVEGTTARIESVEKDAEIQFVYAVSDKQEYFRYLVYGLFTKDDGSFSMGWHLYKKINIESYTLEGGTYIITCKDEVIEHADGGQMLKIEEGARIVIGKNYAVVSEVISRENGSVTFAAETFTPDEAQKNAYTCHWYD